MSVLLKPPTNNLVVGTSPDGRQCETKHHYNCKQQPTLYTSSFYSQYHLSVQKVDSKNSLIRQQSTTFYLILDLRNPLPYQTPAHLFKCISLGHLYTCMLTSHLDFHIHYYCTLPHPLAPSIPPVVLTVTV